MISKIKKWFKKISWRVVGKFLCNNVLLPYLREVSTKSDNDIDDKLIKALDSFIKSL